MQKTFKLLTFIFLLLLNEGFLSGQGIKAEDWKIIETTNNPIPRHENAFVEHEGKFYMLGGRRIQPVSIFDPSTSTWTKGAPPPIELHHFQGVVYNNLIYVIGAMTGKYPDEMPLAIIYIYDPKQDTWYTGDSIPESRRRGGAGATLVDGKIYLAGGIVHGHKGGFQKWLDVYDPETGEWKILPDAPRERDHFHMVEKNGRLYAFGGRTTSKNTGQTFELTVSECDVYDMKEQKWHSLPKNLPTPRAGTSTIVIGNLVAVIGGESGSQKSAHNEVEAWDTKREQWISLPSLKEGRHGTQAVYFDNKIYIAGGCGNRGGSPELISIEFFKYD